MPKDENLDRLTAFMVEDILATPDDEILAEAGEDGEDPAKVAAEGRRLLERAIADANQRRKPMRKMTKGEKIADNYSECIMERELTQSLAAEIDAAIAQAIAAERAWAKGLVERLLKAADDAAQFLESRNSDTDFDMDGELASIHAALSNEVYHAKEYFAAYEKENANA